MLARMQVEDNRSGVQWIRRSTDKGIRRLTGRIELRGIKGTFILRQAAQWRGSLFVHTWFILRGRLCTLNYKTAIRHSREADWAVSISFLKRRMLALDTFLVMTKKGLEV